MLMKTQKLVLKRLDVLSVAKVYATILAIIGFILGIVTAIISITIGATLGWAVLGIGFGVLAIIILPILFGIMGFVFGAIGAFLYNVAAGRIGGIKLEFESTR
jgi:membrane-associated HD superfamily phosphohydrolase